MRRACLRNATSAPYPFMPVGGLTRAPRGRDEAGAPFQEEAIQMAMSNPATMPWGRPVGAMDKDGQTELEARKRRILRRTAMANAATPASQQALVDAGTIQRVSKGRPLVSQGEPASLIAMIGMGRVRLTRALSDARTLAIGYRGAGDLVGEAALGGAPAYRESAVATEDVEALMVPVRHGARARRGRPGVRVRPARDARRAPRRHRGAARLDALPQRRGAPRRVPASRRRRAGASPSRAAC